jgi:hypothetical protein
MNKDQQIHDLTRQLAEAKEANATLLEVIFETAKISGFIDGTPHPKQLPGIVNNTLLRYSRELTEARRDIQWLGHWLSKSNLNSWYDAKEHLWFVTENGKLISSKQATELTPQNPGDKK